MPITPTPPKGHFFGQVAGLVRKLKSRAFSGGARRPQNRKENAGLMVVETMDARILFSADVLPIFLADQATQSVGAAFGEVRLADLPNPSLDTSSAAIETAKGSGEPEKAGPPAPSTNLEARELIFVDANVPDFSQFISDLAILAATSPQIEIHVIDGSRSGLDQISDIVNVSANVEAIHIFSHGASGQLQLGNALIDAGALRQNASRLEAWQTHLASGADIRLYGCDVAQGDAGELFVKTLSALVGADVAASDDLSGSPGQGNWRLEYSTGVIDESLGIDTSILNDIQAPLAITSDPIVDSISSTGSSTISFSHTVGTGANAYLVVSVASLSKTVTSVTFDGVAMTFLNSVQGGGPKPIASLWGLVAPPATSGTVFVTMSGNNNAAAGAETFYGVDPANPVGQTSSATGNAATPSLSLIAPVGDLVVDAIAVRATGMTSVGPNQTLSYDISTGSAGGQIFGASSSEPGNGSTNMSWSFAQSGAGEWASVAVVLQAFANSAPVITFGQGAQIAGENAGPILIDTLATVSDPDASDWSGVQLLVDVPVNGQSYDRVTIRDEGSSAGQVGVIGSGVFLGGVQVGSFSGSGAPLSVIFNGNASQAAVQAVMRNVQFEATGEDPSTVNRTVRFQVIDKLGAASASITKTISVVTDNDIWVTTASDIGDGDTSSITALMANRGSDGKISLAEAIAAANNTANAGGPDKIYFNIGAGGLQTLNLASSLPLIQQAVIIDARTQVGWSGAPLIEINGSVPGGDGFNILGNGVSILGFALNHFSGNAIKVQAGADNALIQSNYIGTNNSGTAAAGGNSGIQISANSAMVGGTSSGQGNLIAGLSNIGIEVVGGAVGTIIQGNRIGTDLTGTSLLGTAVGITLNNAVGTTVGGTVSGAGNQIVNTSTNAVWILGSSSNSVFAANLINVDATGSSKLGAGRDFYISASNGTQIGDVNSGANVLASNTTAITLDSTAQGVVFLSNRFIGSGGMLIDLNNDGATPNDALDTDVGANNLFNTPILNTATVNGGQISVTGTYSGLANTYVRVAIYAGSVATTSGFGSGGALLGYVDTQTNGAGLANFSGTVSAPASDAHLISAVATRSNAGYVSFFESSEFSANITASSLNLVTVAPTITASAPEILINPTATNLQYGPDYNAHNIARGASGTLIYTYFDYNGDGSGIGQFVRILDASGNPITGAIQVNQTTGGDQSFGAVASDAGGNFTVVWSSTQSSGAGAGIYGRRFDSNGNALGNEFKISATSSGMTLSPSIAMNASGQFVVAWELSQGSNSDVHARRYNAAGNAQGSEFVANTYVTNLQNYATVTINNAGAFAIGWNSNNAQDGSGWGSYMQLYDAVGAVVGGETRINVTTAGNQQYPNLQLTEVQTLIATWTSGPVGAQTIYGRLFSATGTALTGEFQLTGNASDNTFGASLSADSSGNFVVSWTDGAKDGSGDGVYARRFSAGGTALGAQFQASTTSTGSQGFTRNVLMDNGDLFVSWEGQGTGDADGVFVRHWAADSRTSEAGRIINYQVVLNSAPTSNVTLTFAVSDSTEGQLTYSTLTFTPGNWNVAQVLTLTGVDDALFDGAVNYTLRMTSASGDLAFNGPLMAPRTITNQDNDLLVSTAADITDGDTSSIAALLANPGGDGQISLREAILASNNSTNGSLPDHVGFAIGTGPQTITLASGLTISDAVSIDGTTQTGYSGTPLIRLDGGGLGVNLITLNGASSSGSTIRGLSLTGGSRGIFLNGSSNNQIMGNWIGLMQDGVTAAGNANHGIEILGGSGNLVGSANAADRNIIVNNGVYGIALNTGTSANIIQGNFIGTNTGSAGTAMGNGSDGVFLFNGSSNNLIGGVNPGEGNLIAYNAGQGVEVASGTGNAILGNSIRQNGGLGIDLNWNGTAQLNDLNDADGGANNGQNYPVLTSVSSAAGATYVAGFLDGLANTTYRVDFFVSPSGDVSGYGEGTNVPISLEATTDGSGHLNFSFSYAASTVAGYAYTATATVKTGPGTYRDTSEFSAWVTVVTANSAPTLTNGAVFSLPSTNEDSASPPFTVASLLMGAGWADIDTAPLQGIAITGISGNNAWSYSVDGSTWYVLTGVAANNAALFTGSTLLRYTPDAQNGETATVSFRAWDQTDGNLATSSGSISYANPGAGGGTSAFSSQSAFGSLDVAPVNDAPVISNGASIVLTATNEDTTSVPMLVSGLLSSAGWVDVDTGALRGIAITATSGNGYWQYSADGIGWTAFGSVSPGSALLLDAGTQIRYQPDLANGETASFSFRGWDQTSGIASTNAMPAHGDATSGGSASAFSSQSATAAVSILALNDAPVMLAPGTLPSQFEDSSAPVTLVASLVDTEISDVDTGASKGIAVFGVTDGGNGSWQYTTDGSTWLALSGVTSGSARLLAADATTAIRFVPNANAGGFAPTISYLAWDQTSGLAGTLADASASGAVTAFSSAQADIALSVISVNDAPGGLDQVRTFNENTAGAPSSYVFLASDFGFTDAADAPANVLAGVFISSLPGAGSLTLSGSAVSAGQLVTAAQLAAGNLVFTPAVNDNGAAYASFGFQVQDDGGVANGGVDVDTLVRSFAFNVSSANTAPWFASNSLTTTEGGSTVLTSADISTADFDNASNALTISVTGLLHGQFEYLASPGTAISNFTQADINAALVRFVHDGSQFAPAYSLTVSDGSLSTGPKAANILFGGANDPPLISYAGGPTAINEDSFVVFSAANGNAITLADPDAGAALVQLTLSASQGKLSLSSLSGLTFLSGINGSATFVVQGSLGSLNNALNGLTYSPNAHFNGPDTITLLLDDLGNTGAGGSLADSQVISMTVIPVNDAPVTLGSSVTLIPVFEDAANPQGATVTSLFAALFSDALDAANPTMNQFSGVAIRSAAQNSSDGFWQYSINAGSSWGTFGSLSDAAAVALAPEDLIRFVPAPDFNGPVSGTLSLRLLDNSVPITSGTQIDVSAFSASASFSSGIITLDTSITPVNDAPTLQPLNVTLDENPLASTLLGSLHFQDVDTGDNLSVTIAAPTPGSVDAALLSALSIDAQGRVFVTNPAAFDFESSTQGWKNHTLVLNVIITDSHGANASAALQISLRDVNESPTDLKLAVRLSLNSPAEALGSFSPVDQDSPESYSFALLNDPAQAFSIDSKTGVLSLTPQGQNLTNSGRTNTITVSISDKGGLQIARTFTVTMPSYYPVQDTGSGGGISGGTGTGNGSGSGATLMIISGTDATATLSGASSAAQAAQASAARSKAVSLQFYSPSELGHSAIDNPILEESVRDRLPQNLYDSANRGRALDANSIGNRSLTPREGITTISSLDFQALLGSSISLDEDRGRLDLRMNARGALSASRPEIIGQMQSQVEPSQEDAAHGVIQMFGREPIFVTSAIISAGAVWWVARGMVLLTALMAGTPAWRQVDMLPILLTNDRDDMDSSAIHESAENQEACATTAFFGDADQDFGEEEAMVSLFEVPGTYVRNEVQGR